MPVRAPDFESSASAIPPLRQLLRQSLPRRPRYYILFGMNCKSYTEENTVFWLKRASR